jgi:hypothetical protein
MNRSAIASLVSVFLLGMSAQATVAGTLTVQFMGGPQYLDPASDVYTFPDYDGYPLVLPPNRSSFVFDVPSLRKLKFDFRASLNKFSADDTDEPLYNPQNATLISRPDGNLEGYAQGLYEIKVRPGRVEVDGYLEESDHKLWLTSDRVVDDHNDYYVAYASDGYWTASYENGEPAPIPVPAGLPLLAGGLLLMGLLKRSALRG